MGYVVVVFEDDKVCVVACYYFAFAVVCTEAPGGVDGAGVEGGVKGNHGLFNQDLEAFVHVEGASCYGVGAFESCQAVFADFDVMAAQLVVASGRAVFCA